MLPAIAAHAIHAYIKPGDLVFDPMCGIGTTVVEAMHAGRDVIGVEYESRWADDERAALEGDEKRSPQSRTSSPTSPPLPGRDPTNSAPNRPSFL
jgi:tRNA G10  N-methylase Trm11